MSGLIQSYSGKAVTPLFLRPEQVTFEDIPHALAQKVRFNGHLRELGYSVAQHCVIGAQEILPPGGRHAPALDIFRYKLAFLLHEVSEVYLPDVPAPIKRFLHVAIIRGGDSTYDTWADLETQHAQAFLDALGLPTLFPLLDSTEVKTTDRRMLVTEKRDLRMPELDPSITAQEAWQKEYPPFETKIERVWGPQEAKERFTELYRFYRAELG